jgi:hypothetical protein
MWISPDKSPAALGERISFLSFTAPDAGAHPAGCRHLSALAESAYQLGGSGMDFGSTLSVDVYFLGVESIGS